MPLVRCNACVGSGRVMGGGMMTWDCDQCEGSGKIDPDKDSKHKQPEKFKMDKESKHYKKAIKKIKALDIKLTDKDAENIFDDELAKSEK